MKNKQIVIPITNLMRKKCDDFAHEVIGTSMDQYRSRGQNDLSMATRQTSDGKIGEIAVMAHLHKRLGFQVNKPDFGIYGSKDKSFGPDLTSYGCNIHVKTWANRNVPESWIFQYGGYGPGNKDPLLERPSDLDYVAFCRKDDDRVVIRGIVSAQYLSINRLFKEPTKEHLKATKRAVYFNDLMNLHEEILWSFVTQVEKAGLLRK